MPTLKCTEQHVFKVNYSDLERYIKELTGKSIEIPAILECRNDTDHDIAIGHHSDWLDEDDKKDAEDFLFGTATDVPTNSLQYLMETMFLHNMLKKGNYIIKVSW